jgi:hypothetical protein
MVSFPRIENKILSIMLYTHVRLSEIFTQLHEDGREYYFSDFWLQPSVYGYLSISISFN